MLTLVMKTSRTTVEMMDLLGVLAQLGCTITADIGEGGRAEARDGDVLIMAATMADRREGWTVGHFNSATIRWD